MRRTRIWGGELGSIWDQSSTRGTGLGTDRSRQLPVSQRTVGDSWREVMAGLVIGDVEKPGHKAQGVVTYGRHSSKGRMHSVSGG